MMRGVRVIVGATLALLAAGTAIAQTPRVLTLREAEKQALEHQPQLVQARAATAAAEARSDEARSGFLPQVTGTLGYTRSTGNYVPRPGAFIGAVPPAGTSWDTFNSFSASETLNQLIWDFNQTLGKWQAAQAAAKAQGQTGRSVELQILVTVRSAYFNARAGKALQGVAQEALANLEKHLAQTDGFVHAGTHPEIDLVTARTNVANGKVQLINAENTYLTAKAILNQAMGSVADTDYDIADDAAGPVEGEDSPLEGLVDEAVKARPELVALEAQLEAQRKTLASVKGAYWPVLAASLGSNQGGIQMNNLGWNVAAGVTLTWPIFQGGLTWAQSREASAGVDQVAGQLEQERQQVRLDVDQARLGVRAAKAGLIAQHEVVANAREQLRLAEARYETGVGNAVELNDAQTAMTTAEAQLVQVDAQLATARAQLLHALGRE